MQPKISKSCFALVAIFVALFTATFLIDAKLYDFISREDHLVEYLSSLFLFLASFCFLKSFISSKKHNFSESKWIAFLLLGISILFFLAAGEEISWGQRLFNISTPEYLASINEQNELNFHNINKKFFDRLVDRATIIFVIVASALLLLKREVLPGIKNPDVFIICAFSITPFYREGSQIDFHHLLYLPLIALLIYAVFKKDRSSLLTITTTLIITCLIPIIHTKYNHLFPVHGNSESEIKEFLFCLCCLSYSYVIMHKIARNPAGS